ncbi:hypothetical protein [Natranaerobius thermophilus]|uniref:Uncharacterized protein n=1 Tax=Natranaerobius thermophilus (strain ATCC BAA-1301 / DSM 18059 / JW/NM-WN-LF) TaxID=457570 RepID=B2A813_NATTJ|nr:hypothetical protein [Natranaerobius thermophilus]ACB85785.1 hypothetical protein Nther_2219 [Natranaerobius thermophilus JW/NM-WN-LF]
MPIASIHENILKALGTIRNHPKLLYFALGLMIFFYILTLPLLLNQGNFYIDYADMDFGYIMEQVMPYMFPGSPPIGLPHSGENYIPADATQIGLIPFLVAGAITTFLAPAYLGLIRTAVRKDQGLCEDKLELDTFLSYGGRYFLKFLFVFLILGAVFLAAGLVFGTAGYILGLIFGRTALISSLVLNVVLILISFNFIFVEFEILEHEREESIIEVILSALSYIGNVKNQLIWYVCTFFLIGLVTMGINLTIDSLPVISYIVIPLISTGVLTVLLLTLYHYYRDIADASQEPDE